MSTPIPGSTLAVRLARENKNIILPWGRGRIGCQSQEQTVVDGVVAGNIYFLNLIHKNIGTVGLELLLLLQ